jgi:hypothetical protein
MQIGVWQIVHRDFDAERIKVSSPSMGWGSVTALSAMADDNHAGQIRYWFEATLRHERLRY